MKKYKTLEITEYYNKDGFCYRTEINGEEYNIPMKKDEPLITIISTPLGDRSYFYEKFKRSSLL